MQYVVTESCPQIIFRISQAGITETELELQIANLRVQLQSQVNSFLSSMLPILTLTLQ